MVYKNILEAVGNTPLIELQNMTDVDDAKVFVKYEGMNVGGSIKTRTAMNMILEAEKRGDLHENSIIVEATSGNQGIGLALVGAVKGYEVVIIMPDSVSEERRKIVKQYGATLELVHDEGDIGECIAKCMALAKKMNAENENVYLPNQFSNFDNVAAQYENTGKEILEALDCPIDAFCAGIGTGGTLTGIGHALKEVYPDVHVVALEPDHAAILSGCEVGDHIQMGIGDGVIPDILDRNVYDEIMIVSDEEALQTSKELARKEGILAGISSGTNVFAALKLAKRLGKGKVVVTVLPDTGERYFSTKLFD